MQLTSSIGALAVQRWPAALAMLLSTLLAVQATQYHPGAGYGPAGGGALEAELLAAAVADHHHHQYQQHPKPYTQQHTGCVLNIKPLNATTTTNQHYAVTRNTYLSYQQSEAAGKQAGAICITQHDVDAAVEEAKLSLGGYVPKEIYTANSEHPTPMNVIIVAEIVAQATRILANRFKLPEPAILYDLPAVDLSKSYALDKICPVFLKPSVNCEQTRYRTLTGFCNNLQYQSWGSTRSALVRFLAPDYYDSISLPRRAYDGSPLPSPRVVSFVVHQDPVEYDKYHTMLSVVWGQFMNHDLTLAVRATDENPATGAEKVDCCKSEDSHPDCFPIEIPKGDPFYGYFSQKCMHFMRSSAGLQPGCSLGPIQPINKISSYIDGNIVYGASIKASQRLRAYQGGQLRSQQVNSSLAYGSSASAYDESSSLTSAYASNGDHHAALGGPNSADYLMAAGSQQHQLQRMAAAGYQPQGVYGAAYKELLPANRHSPDTGCERRGRAKDVYCFDAGDPRSNEQISLASLHTMFMREHNRVARELSYINPYWSDERLFQEARQIIVAQLQHVTFNEFLPLVIGKEKIYEYGLELEQPGRYYQGYDSKINAGVRVEFQAAAFRYGHSLIPSYIERYNKYHQKIESIRLSKLLSQPFDLYHPGVLDTYLLGLVDQRSGRMDPTLTTEVTNHLFEKPGKFFGVDLAAINIQRGRDMGVPGYNHFREYCGLTRAKYFEDLTGTFSNKTLLRMSQLYKHVDDIDLWTAGISEYPIQDGLVGPTFACLIARQFVNLRRGDRFWYENAGYPAQFTIEQLDEIRKSTAARLVCDNSDEIETIQASAMLIADPYTNPRVPCATLPSIDLTKWKEQGGAPHYEPSAASGSPHYEPSSPLEHAPVYGPPEAEYAGESANLAAGIAAELDEYTANKLAGHQQAAAAAAGENAYQSSELVSNFEPLKTTSHQQHFVDHLVDASQYRPEITPYTSAANSKKAAKAA